MDLVVLGPAISDRFRVAAAHHGEWRVAILMLDVGGTWLAQVELELGQEGRELIADASRRR
jgi:hypothetical protein